MKFYLTTENITKLKRSFLNLKLFSIIYVPEILEQYGYTYSTIDEYGSFIVSSNIEAMIRLQSKSKRIRGIIYSNPSITEEILPNLFEMLNKNKLISEIVLLDDSNIPKLKYLYPYFNEIVFFPSIKKIRLIEAKSIEELSGHTLNLRKL